MARESEFSTHGHFAERKLREPDCPFAENIIRCRALATMLSHVHQLAKKYQLKDSINNAGKAFLSCIVKGLTCTRGTKEDKNVAAHYVCMVLMTMHLRACSG